MVGKRFYISYEQGDSEKIFSAIITKNTRPGEKPFRLTWFKIVASPACLGFPAEQPYLKPAGHIDFKTNNLPLIQKRLEKTFNNHPFLPPTDFKIKVNIP